MCFLSGTKSIVNYDVFSLDIVNYDTFCKAARSAAGGAKRRPKTAERRRRDRRRFQEASKHVVTKHGSSMHG